MNREDIILMAREACSPDAPLRQFVGGVDCGLLMKDEHLERFAALVRAAEREAILQMSAATWFKTQADYDAAIRARGQA
jgi:hypothetical protein